MKLKNAILTSAIVLAATSAQAADINSPFYLPSKGKMLSETSIDYYRVNEDRSGNKAFGGYSAKQEFTYGVSNNVSILAAISNTFDSTFRGASGIFNNDHNYDYTIGAKYNHSFNNIITQASIAYNTYQLDSFIENMQSKAWNKNLVLEAKAGYQMDCGLLPYFSFTADYALNTVRGVAKEVYSEPLEGHFAYSTYVGAYKDFGKFSTDMGIKWNYLRHGQYILGGGTKNRDSVYAQAEVNYKINDTMSVGVYGDYLIGDSIMSYIKYDYTLGANFKVEF